MVGAPVGAQERAGDLDFDDVSRWGDVCLDDVLRAFSRDISNGAVDERAVAAEMLGFDPRAASRLLRGLSDPAADVRQQAAHSLASLLGAPDWSIDALVRALADHDAGVRAHAATALARHRQMPAAVAALEGAQGDPVASVRAAARRALRG